MANAADTANYEILTLTKDGKELALEGKTTSFDYYESLLSPNITAVMTFVDTGNSVNYDKKYDPQERKGTIYNALPLTGTGDEEVRFKITSKLGTLDFSRTPLYVNSAVNSDQESNREAVFLSLVSKTAITNQETHVKKNYTGRSNSASVSIIAENLLGIPKDKLEIDKTANGYPFIGNMKSPFEVIMMLAAKSTFDDGNPGFFFYETRDGHKFKAIDNLIKKSAVAEYYKTDVNVSSVNSNTDFKISSFSINKNQNLINAMKSGVYSSRRVYFNPQTFQEEESSFSIKDLPQSLGKSEPPKPEAGLKSDKYTRVLYSVKDVGALSSQVKSTETTSSKPQEWQGEVQMRYNLLMAQIAKIQVPCNPNLKAGDVIKCHIQVITDDDKVQGTSDPFSSGNYLIMDLCHHYDPKNSYTAMTIVRDTYGFKKSGG